MGNIILGIDPGTNVTGYSLINCECAENIKLIAMGVFDLKKLNTYEQKIKTLFSYTNELMKQYRPQCMVFEDAFYSKNVQVVLKLGRLQGILIACASLHNISIHKYSPTKIKANICGQGNAKKEKIAQTLKTFFGLEENLSYMDATDALAVAVCHIRESNIVGRYTGKQNRTTKQNWKKFIKDNPETLLT